jgi:hypothetical protein
VAAPAPPAPAGLTSDPPVAGAATSAPLFDKRQFTVDPATGRLRRLTREEKKEALRRARMRRSLAKPLTPRDIELMGAMAAAGANPGEMARAFKRTPTAVRQHLAKPELQKIIEDHRLRFRAQAIEQAEAIQHKAWSLADEALEMKDAKMFDAVTRGIAAMERTAASASGENKPAALNVNVGVQTVVSPEERAELLAAWKATVLEADRG